MTTTTRRKGAKVLDEGEIPGSKPRQKKSREERRAEEEAADDSRFIERRAAESFADEADQEQTCRTCGCTHSDPCEHEGDACSWVAGDPTLCTACEELGPLLASDRDAAIRKFLAPATDDDKTLLRSLNGRPLSREEVMEWDFDWLPASALIDYRVRRGGLAVKAPNRGGMVPWEDVVERLTQAETLTPNPSPASGEGGNGKGRKRRNDGLGSATPDAIARNDPEATAIDGVPLPGRNGIEGDPSAWRDLAPGENAESPHPQPLSRNGRGETEPERMIRLDLIDPSPFQPRVEFDESALDELGDTIVAEGLRDAIIVRPTPVGRYELVDGERRVRSCRRKGLTEIRASIRRLTDAQVVRDIMVGFLQRRDLNAIEQARGFQRSLEVLGCTQADLAKRVGCTPSAISNALRLLEAPKKWLDRVVSGEMEPTFLRAALTWLPLAPLEKELDRAWKNLLLRDESPSRQAWEEEVLRAVRNATPPLHDAHYYDHKAYVSLDVTLDPTPEERERLGIIDVPDWQGKAEPRCTNKALHAKLWPKAVAEALKTHKAKQAEAKKGRVKAQKVSPAEAKRRAADAVRKKQEEREDLFYAWSVALCADALEDSQANPEGYHLLLACLALNEDGGVSGSFAGVLLKQLAGRSLWTLDSATSYQLIRAALVESLRRMTGPNVAPYETLEHTDVDGLRAVLEIDLDAQWCHRDRKSVQQFAGGLTERLWDTYTVGELLDLAKREFKIAADLSKSTHAEIVRSIHGQAKILPLPKEWQKLAKPPRAKGKKKGGKGKAVKR